MSGRYYRAVVLWSINNINDHQSPLPSSPSKELGTPTSIVLLSLRLASSFIMCAIGAVDGRTFQMAHVVFNARHDVPEDIWQFCMGVSPSPSGW